MMGEYSEDLEEAARKTAFYLSKELSKHHQVLSLDIKKRFSKNFWREAKEFNPQIIHHIPGPSFISLMIIKMLALYCKDVKTVMSATHPSSFAFSKKIIPYLKPDLVLNQSKESERMFIDLGCETEFLPSGVDTEKFVPVSKDVKEELREKYEIDKDKFVILHVGSIKKGRGIEIFLKIKTRGDQVIIIGNRSLGIEKHLYQNIKESGCNIWINYFKNIEEFYALSDCYIFPIVDKMNSIEMPLSVLEAMSCNLPVISTKFGALPRVFREGDGLIYAEKEEDFIRAIGTIKRGIEVKTREKVIPYSWENIGMKLDKIYNEILQIEEVKWDEK